MRLCSKTLMTGLWMNARKSSVLARISSDRSENMFDEQVCDALSTQDISSSCKLLQTHTQQTGRIRTSHDDVERAFTFPAHIEKRLNVWPAIIFTLRLYARWNRLWNTCQKDSAGRKERCLTTHTFSDKAKETKTKLWQTVVSRTEQPAWKKPTPQRPVS